MAKEIEKLRPATVAALTEPGMYGDGHGHRPTMTKGGRYLTLTVLIFQFATGRAADVERPCAEVLDGNRADTRGGVGFFGPRRA